MNILYRSYFRRYWSAFVYVTIATQLIAQACFGTVLRKPCLSVGLFMLLWPIVKEWVAL